MDIGVIFPQTEVGHDLGAVRAIGQAAQDLGFTHLAAYDHVLGGDVKVHGDLGGPYTVDDTFREPLRCSPTWPALRTWASPPPF